MAEETKESMPHHDKNQLPVEREFDLASFSSDETQTGVKTVEAVSQTWTQSALIAAYLGCVQPHCVVGHVISVLLKNNDIAFERQSSKLIRGDFQLSLQLASSSVFDYLHVLAGKD